MLLVDGGQEIEGDIRNLLITDGAVTAFFQRLYCLRGVPKQLAVLCDQLIINRIYDCFMIADPIDRRNQVRFKMLRQVCAGAAEIDVIQPLYVGDNLFGDSVQPFRPDGIAAQLALPVDNTFRAQELRS